MPLARQFLSKGYGVLLPEYRGFGGNLGHPTELGLYRDAESAITFLHKHHMIALMTVGG